HICDASYAQSQLSCVAGPNPEVPSVSLHVALPILSSLISNGGTFDLFSTSISVASTSTSLVFISGFTLERLTTFPFTSITSSLLDRKSTPLNSSHVSTSSAVFCLQKK